MKDIELVVDILNAKEYELNTEIEKYNKLRKRILKERHNLNLLEQIRGIITVLGEETQKSAQKEIEDAVTIALQSIFGSEYQKFILQYDNTKRDQNELKFLLEHNGITVEPKENTESGGVIDICSFALRIVLWTIDASGSPPIMLLDEPFKNISGGYLQRAIEFVKTISSLLGIQIIMATHIDSFIDAADNIIVIDQKEMEYLKQQTKGRISLQLSM